MQTLAGPARPSHNPRLLLLALLGLITLLCPAPALSSTKASGASNSAVHKVQVSDPILGGLITTHGGRLLADYGSYQLYEAPQVDPALASNSKTEIRDEYNFIFLNAARLDTRQLAVQALRKAVGNFEGKRLHLVQFVGPVQPAWRDQLLSAGVQIVAYIPQNAYLLYGDSSALGRVQQLAAAVPHIQWDSPYLDDYKVHPAARQTDEKGNPRGIGTDLFAIQLVADAAANSNTVALVEQLALEPGRRRDTVLNYLNLVVRIAPENLGRLAARPDVVSIQPYFPRKKFDERQDQIVAGNLSGNIPNGPGYLAWLASKGFDQAQFTASGFAADVSDSGIDDGTTSPGHFGLYLGGDLTNGSRVIYNRLEGTPNPGSTMSGCDGHGTLNSHIIGGQDNLSGFPFCDGSGFHYGLGVCPFVKLGSSVIFDPANFTYPNFNNLQSDAYQDGARVSNNSWGSHAAGQYDVDAQNYDALVRDAQPAGSTFAAAGNQEMVIVFAAGNDGPGGPSIGPPASAKNIISVGASENVHPFGGPDGSGISDADADSANDVAFFSSRGPCADGRHKPDLMAPGTHVSGGVSEAANPAPTGTADPCFTGSGVSGGTNGNFFPDGQQFYTASSGTSHAAPCVVGACALLRQYFLNYFTHPPSPAMTKASLMNSAGYMNGAGANDTFWSDHQGMGRLDLGLAFDGTSRILRDQLPADLFTGSGQTRTFTGAITDTNKPFRVTLAWTDAPGNTAGDAYANNLDLVVTAGGNTCKGNVFAGAYSVTGGAADLKNNVESVFLPAGVSGNFAIKVAATSINSIGVPNPDNILEQDFALVIYNAAALPAPVIAPADWTLIAESCFPTNNAIDPGEMVTVDFALQNAGVLNTTNLVATLRASGGVTSPGAPQTYGALVAGGAPVGQPFTFTATGACGGTIVARLDLQDGPASRGTVDFNLRLGRPVAITNFAENFDLVVTPDLPPDWTTAASGAQSVWVTSSTASDTAPNAAFANDPPNIGLSTLVTPPILIGSSSAQLIFWNNYNLEASGVSSAAYDGGVLEIQIGNGGFTDILSAGGSFVTGGYNRTISSAFGNPLAGRQAWSGNSGGFIATIANLPALAAGQNIKLRWVCGSDMSFGRPGWFIDSVSIQDSYYSCCPLIAPVLVNPRLQDTHLLFSFQSISGQTYKVEYTDALTNSAWTLAQTVIGDGSLRTITNVLSSPHGYYRLRSP